MCLSFAGAFNAFDKDGDGIIKLNVLEVSQFYSNGRQQSSFWEVRRKHKN